MGNIIKVLIVSLSFTFSLLTCNAQEEYWSAKIIMTRPLKDFPPKDTCRDYLVIITNATDTEMIGKILITGDTLKAAEKAAQYGYEYIKRYDAATDVLDYINLEYLVKIFKEVKSDHWRQLEAAVKRYREIENKYRSK